MKPKANILSANVLNVLHEHLEAEVSEKKKKRQRGEEQKKNQNRKKNCLFSKKKRDWQGEEEVRKEKRRKERRIWKVFFTKGKQIVFPRLLFLKFQAKSLFFLRNFRVERNLLPSFGKKILSSQLVTFFLFFFFSVFSFFSRCSLAELLWVFLRSALWYPLPTTSSSAPMAGLLF